MATGTVGIAEELMLVDPVDGRQASAGDVVLEAAQEWLGADADRQVEQEFKMEQTELGDLDFVLEGVARLRRTGTGADRQRNEFARRGRLSDVVQHAAQRTLE